MSLTQEFKLWLSRIPNTEPIMKTDRFERGSYMVFDTATWDCMRKVCCCDNRRPPCLRFLWRMSHQLM